MTCTSRQYVQDTRPRHHVPRHPTPGQTEPRRRRRRDHADRCRDLPAVAGAARPRTGFAERGCAGAAAGAASGYVVGALIGASVPRWEPLTETSAPATIVARDPRRHAGLSALSVTPVVARPASAGDNVGVGAAVSYLSQLSPHIAVGGEVARYGVATSQYPSRICTPGMLCLDAPAFGHMWSFGGLARLGSGADLGLEPYGLIGLGVTNFGAVTLGSYSVGPGVRVRPGDGRFAVSAEARWHSNFTNSGDESQLGFYTLGVALSMLR